MERSFTEKFVETLISTTAGFAAGCAVIFGVKELIARAKESNSSAGTTR